MNRQKAFTLIELLVVISIIAILSAVGLVSYNGIRGKAQDAKIKSDINAIKKAYESNYDPTANNGQGGYKPLTNSDFASGKIPTPDGTSTTSYFIAGPNSVNPPATAPNFALCAPLKAGVICPSSNPGDCSCTTSTQGIPVDPSVLNGIPASGLVLWLKADTINGSNGSVITSWQDASSNNTAVTILGSPTKQSGPNGKSVIRFLALTGSPRQNFKVTRNFPAPFSVIYVARMISGSSSRILSGIGNNWLLGWWRGEMKASYFEGWVSRGPATDNNFHLFAGISTGIQGGSATYENGANVTTPNNPQGITGPNGLTIGHNGASEFSDTDIAEIIVYNQALIDSDRKRVEQYLGRKYGITVSN